MKKWQIIAPIGIAAAAAAAVLAMRKKPQAAADAKPAPAAKKPAPAAQLKTGSYSFVSGYKDAATVEVKVGYDPERFSFAVIEDSFPAYSSDSHVAVIYGEDFTAQIEYAGYYHGEDFAAMSAAPRHTLYRRGLHMHVLPCAGRRIQLSARDGRQGRGQRRYARRASGRREPRGAARKRRDKLGKVSETAKSAQSRPETGGFVYAGSTLI